ncbi:MAG: DUF2842 domain-containing protein [Hyphomicrobiales bacterium]
MSYTKPSGKKLIGTFVLILFVLVYIVVTLWIAARFIDPLGAVAQIVFYAFAGLAWAVPAIGIIRWFSGDEN